MRADLRAVPGAALSTARLLSERPLVEFDAEGQRVLARDLVIDLGCILVGLIGYAGVETRGDEYGASSVLTVPAGFVCDGASLPWWTLPVLGPKERYECAGLAHDACYHWQVDRATADHVFWLVARSGSKHVGPVRARLGWLGLRIGGWVAYRRRGAEATASPTSQA